MKGRKNVASAAACVHNEEARIGIFLTGLTRTLKEVPDDEG